MSVITEVAIFPLGQTKGLSKYVKKAVAIIQESGFQYSVTSMGTLFETETLEQSLAIIQTMYDVLEADAERVYCTAKFDISKEGGDRMTKKVESLGLSNK